MKRARNLNEDQKIKFSFVDFSLPLSTQNRHKMNYNEVVVQQKKFQYLLNAFTYTTLILNYEEESIDVNFYF